MAGILAGGDKAKAGQIISAMQAQADQMEEGILLQIGDSNPQGADLLGVQEFLRKSGSSG